MSIPGYDAWKTRSDLDEYPGQEPVPEDDGLDSWFDYETQRLDAYLAAGNIDEAEHAAILEELRREYKAAIKSQTGA